MGVSVRKSGVRWRKVAVPLVLLVALAAPARADSADALYKRGVDLRRAGKDAEALETFKQLADVDKSARVAAQMGLAEQALGMWVEAEGHIQDSLKGGGDQWIAKNRDILVRALDEIGARLGNIDVWGEPVGAEVLIDGKVVGALPLPHPVRAVVGSIPITVRAAGYQDRVTVISLMPNQSARERFVLQPVEKVRLAKADLLPVPVPPSVRDPMRPRDEPVASAGKLRASGKWIAWGAGAAALGVGVFAAVRQDSAGNDFDTSCALDATGAARARAGIGKTDGECAGLKGDVDSAFRLEVVGLAGAAAFGALGLVLWLTEPSPVEARSARLDCAPALPSRTSPWLVCSLRF